jgi:thiamine pyrophosphokinase
MDMKYERCVIITAWHDAGAITGYLPEKTDLILCADGGYQFAENAGIVPHAVIGDFDSAPRPPNGSMFEIVGLPREKDESDTLACVKYGMGRGLEHFVILGGLSGRIDHTYANIQTLSYLADMQCKAEIIDGTSSAVMLDGIKKNIYQFMADLDAEDDSPAQDSDDGEDWKSDAHCHILENQDGYKFSVFAYEEICSGVYIRNARYPLEDAALTQSYPIGLSNEFAKGKDAEIWIRRGRLLVLKIKE